MARRPVTMVVNGRRCEVLVEPRWTLADVLRESLELTGTHLGCEHGVCGACTVLVDGVAVRSCLIFGAQADGADIVTIEGLERDGELHPLQQAFHETHGFQCGFCTPGFVMSALELLEDDGELSEAELRELLAGNLCRCTGYQSIIDGVVLAAQRMAARA
ncbi:MAG: (2Fe-2S)-binding protein [Acidimicrobiia bacterium]